MVSSSNKEYKSFKDKLVLEDKYLFNKMDLLIKILNFYLGYVNGQIEVELTVNAFGPPIALG